MNMVLDITEFFIQIVLALLPILATIITAKVIPLISAKISEEDRDKVVFWAEIAIIAIEKKYEGSTTEDGKLKKEFVTDFLINQLNVDKFVTREQLSLIIDAVVETTVNKGEKQEERPVSISFTDPIEVLSDEDCEVEEVEEVAYAQAPPQKEEEVPRAKVLANYILDHETNIQVDVPLSVYTDTFLVLGEEKGVNGDEAFIQHALDTNFLKDNHNTSDEFPDIPKQVGEILDNIIVTEEARQIAGDIK